MWSWRAWPASWAAIPTAASDRLAGLGLPPPARGERLVSLFCYEPPALPALLGQLAAQGARLLVTPGRAQVALEAALVTLGSAPKPAWNLLPPLPQTGFDELLWACDLNFVRGEDSLVRALWAGRPFVWQIYPQHDGVHLDKLDAFLDWLQAPASLRQAHAAWNQAQARAGTDPTFPRQGTLPWPALDLPAWTHTARAARERLGAGPELVAQLIAACALLDAVAVAVMGGSWPWVAACIVAYVLCRLFQRFIPGT